MSVLMAHHVSTVLRYIAKAAVQLLATPKRRRKPLFAHPSTHALVRDRFTAAKHRTGNGQLAIT